MKTAIIFNAHGNQPEEVIYPYYRMLEAGFDTKVVGVGETGNYKGRKVIFGKYGMPTPYTDSIDFLKTSRAEQTKVVIIPGGWECPEILRQEGLVLDFINEINKQSIILAAQCHGPWVLISAGVMKGRRATCYKGMKDDLVNAQCEYVDAPVVRDGNIITSPHYRNNPEFMREILVNIK